MRYPAIPQTLQKNSFARTRVLVFLSRWRWLVLIAVHPNAQISQISRTQRETLGPPISCCDSPLFLFARVVRITLYSSMLRSTPSPPVYTYIHGQRQLRVTIRTLTPIAWPLQLHAVHLTAILPYWTDKAMLHRCLVRFFDSHFSLFYFTFFSYFEETLATDAGWYCFGLYTGRVVSGPIHFTLSKMKQLFYSSF